MELFNEGEMMGGKNGCEWGGRNEVELADEMNKESKY